MLALPTVSPTVPRVMHVRSADNFVPALADAMVAADALEFPKGINFRETIEEATLVRYGLLHWWQRTCAPLKLFVWDLHIEQEPGMMADRQEGSPQLYLTLTNGGGRGDLTPHFAIGPGVWALEKECPGFGETALAVLYDAVLYLPNVFCPRTALWWAEYEYWHGCNDESEVIEEMQAGGDYATIEEARKDYDGLTRAEFDQCIPAMAQRPKRHPKQMAAMRACTSRRAQAVLAALDAIYTAVRAKPIARSDFNAVDGWSIYFSVFLRWTADDPSPRIYDDLANEAWQCGDANEYLAVFPMRIEPEHIAQWQRGMENMVALARATEQLILALGKRVDYDA